MTAVEKASQSVKNIVGISVVGGSTPNTPGWKYKNFEEKGMQQEVQSSI